jgi:hypothetical protein
MTILQHLRIASAAAVFAAFALAQPVQAQNGGLPQCKTSFRDRFSSPNLRQGWAWTDPNNDVSYSLRTQRGVLRLSTTAGSDNNLALGSNNGARMLRPVSGEEFVIEAVISTNPIHDYHGGGLLLWQDDNNFVRLERGFGLNGQGVYFAQQSGANFEYTFAPTTDTTVRMRLIRTGSFVDAYIKDSSNTWKRVGNFQTALGTSLQAGVDLIAEFGAPPTVVDADEFTITTCESPNSENE